MRTPKEILEALKSELSSNPEQKMVIFDIDSTLLCTSDRTKQILKDFAHQNKWQRLYPEECEILKTIEVTPSDWGIRSALDRCGLKSTASFFKHLQEFWGQRFFSNHYLHHDPPYEGAVEFVNEIANTGTYIKYLTARDEERMGEGTRKRMKELGFPTNEKQVHFHLKPHINLRDRDFKAKVIKELATQWKMLWYFENEPSIIEKIDGLFSHLQIIFMDTVHSNQAEPPRHLPRIGMSFKA